MQSVLLFAKEVNNNTSCVTQNSFAAISYFATATATATVNIKSPVCTAVIGQRGTCSYTIDT